MEITIHSFYLIISTIAIVGSGVGVSVKINNELTKLKSRIHYLEINDNELKTMLSDIAAKLQHIELLLASNHIKRK